MSDTLSILSLVAVVLAIITSSITISKSLESLRKVNSDRLSMIKQNSDDIRSLATFFHLYLQYRSGYSTTLNERSIDRFLQDHFNLEQ